VGLVRTSSSSREGVAGGRGAGAGIPEPRRRLEGRLVVCGPSTWGRQAPCGCGRRGRRAGARAGEANPFLGLRGSGTLWHPDLLRTQLAAVPGERERGGASGDGADGLDGVGAPFVKDLLEPAGEACSSRGARRGSPGAGRCGGAGSGSRGSAAGARGGLPLDRENDLAQYAMGGRPGQPAVAGSPTTSPCVLVLIRGVVEAGARSGGRLGSAASWQRPRRAPLLVGSV